MASLQELFSQCVVRYLPSAIPAPLDLIDNVQIGRILVAQQQDEVLEVLTASILEESGVGGGQGPKTILKFTEHSITSLLEAKSKAVLDGISFTSDFLVDSKMVRHGKSSVRFDKDSSILEQLGFQAVDDCQKVAVVSNFGTITRVCVNASDLFAGKRSSFQVDRQHEVVKQALDRGGRFFMISTVLEAEKAEIELQIMAKSAAKVDESSVHKVYSRETAVSIAFFVLELSITSNGVLKPKKMGSKRIFLMDQQQSDDWVIVSLLNNFPALGELQAQELGINDSIEINNGSKPPSPKKTKPPAPQTTKKKEEVKASPAKPQPTDTPQPVIKKETTPEKVAKEQEIEKKTAGPEATKPSIQEETTEILIEEMKSPADPQPVKIKEPILPVVEQIEVEAVVHEEALPPSVIPEFASPTRTTNENKPVKYVHTQEVFKGFTSLTYEGVILEAKEWLQPMLDNAPLQKSLLTYLQPPSTKSKLKKLSDHLKKLDTSLRKKSTLPSNPSKMKSVLSNLSEQQEHRIDEVTALLICIDVFNKFYHGLIEKIIDLSPEKRESLLQIIKDTPHGSSTHKYLDRQQFYSDDELFPILLQLGFSMDGGELMFKSSDPSQDTFVSVIVVLQSSSALP